MFVGEFKFAQEGGLEKLGEQVGGYYDLLVQSWPTPAVATEELLKTKNRLALLNKSDEQMAKLATLTVSRRIEDVVFPIILSDANPHSDRLKMDTLAELPFASQIQIFHVGYGLWMKNAITL